MVGSARSGTTLVGAIVDSHARMICANETSASVNFWRGWSAREIVEEIVANSAANYAAGRTSEGYSYAIETDHKDSSEITVIGDKVWNPAVLLMAGQRDLLAGLERLMRCPLALLHCVRNPFDVIATMHRRSGASLRDRMRWYTIQCEAIQMIVERSEFPILLVRHEDLIADPSVVSGQIFEWLGFPTSEEHLSRIQRKVYTRPNKSRLTVNWPSEIIGEVAALTSRFPYLARYSLID